MRIFIFCFLIINNSFSSELYMSEEKALEQGYTKVNYTQLYIYKSKKNSTISQHSLAWPFEVYDKNFLGNNFIQYQPYSGTKNGGYHGGNDMVLIPNSWVYAPISGRLEAGHYSYNDFDNGGREKFWKAWPAQGAKASFEVAVINEDGLRFELHHIDRESLPEELRDCLRQTECFVEKGAKVGKVYSWHTSFNYDHVHVNIIDQNTGQWYNPEYFFNLIEDTIVPDVRVLVETTSGSNFWLEQDHIITETVKNFTLIGSDTKNDSHFHQVPLYADIQFDNGYLAKYDYRYTLKNDFTFFPDIANFFPLAVKLPNGRVQRQELTSSYYPLNAKFIVRLPIDSARLEGAFVITVKDIAGNLIQFSGIIK